MTITTLKIDGLKELDLALKRLPYEIQGKPLRSATSRAARLIRDEAIARAPEDTGNLKESIYRYRSRSQSMPGREVFLVGVRRGPRRRYANTRYNRRKGRVGKTYFEQGKAFYWRFLEFGTAKMQKRPFLRPAFEENKMAAVDLIKERLRIEIDKAARKYAR